MNLLFAAFLSAGLSHAASSPENISAGGARSFQTQPASAFKFQPAGLPSLSAFAQNRVGTIKGGMNHSPVDITIDKRAWTIKGGMNHSPVDVAIDHEKARITGGANHSPVDLAFAWTPESMLVEGGANRSPVKLYVNWKDGILTGHANHSPVKVEFDMKAGDADAKTVELKGYANHAPVVLSFDKVSGRLTGGMNHAPVDVTIVNADLYDFLQYFFLFLGE
ncbi:MAG: hypothetical protein HZB91_00525 [Elusimicrobia bacterium]|nr:hypothetical protein [Elusimicrobiota bacterium]